MAACAIAAPVLIADDDDSFARRLAAALNDEGYRTESISEGKELLRALHLTQFEALIVEPCLPGASWYSLLEGIRKRDHGVVLIAVTAFPSHALRAQCRRLDATILSKPVDCARVIEILHGTRPDEGIEPGSCGRTLAALEWEHINETILESSGNLAEAARRLGIPRQTLYRKLRKHPVLPLR
jgi:two-component system, response regulator RegA